MATATPQQTAPRRPARSGIVTFAGVMFLVAAAFNVLDGVVALARADYYRGQLLFGNLTAWGIWWLFIGALMAVTGWMIVTRRLLGIVFGVSLAGINAVTQLMFIRAYPAWSIAVLVVDGLIIYALTTRVDEFA